MKLDEIKRELKGYFLYKKQGEFKLGIRHGDDFELIVEDIYYLSFKERFKLTPIRYLLMQVNHHLLDPTCYVADIRDVLPVIDFNIFSEYDHRELEIEQHQELLDKITSSKSIFNRKKDFKLVYVVNHNHLLRAEEQIGYYVIKGNDVVPIESALLDEVTVNNAIEVTDLQMLEKALTDDMINQYTENYKEVCRKWDSLI